MSLNPKQVSVSDLYRVTFRCLYWLLLIVTSTESRPKDMECGSSWVLCWGWSWARGCAGGQAAVARGWVVGQALGLEGIFSTSSWQIFSSLSYNSDTLLVTSLNHRRGQQEGLCTPLESSWAMRHWTIWRKWMWSIIVVCWPWPCGERTR